MILKDFDIMLMICILWNFSFILLLFSGWDIFLLEFENIFGVNLMIIKVYRNKFCYIL